ncbi:MAG: hypothetical protein CSA45_06020 [Gammaproteobacteria bacterium]|nr:MAG: hypothetical protein CSA45_06020 [Gammaproteobacteria bacterium]
MNSASEELGAEEWIDRNPEKFRDAKPLYAHTRGNDKRGQFDKIYQTSDGRIIIIEAKGGNGTLTGRKIGGENVQQGHPDYRKDVIKNYSKQFERAKKDPNVSPEDYAKMQETNEALQATLDPKNGDSPKFVVEYYVVRQTIDKNGNPGRITVHQFN